jgi:hypothetical protein
LVVKQAISCKSSRAADNDPTTEQVDAQIT